MLENQAAHRGEELRTLARRYHGEMIAERGMDLEAQILEVIRDLRQSERILSVKDITSWLVDRHGEDYERKIATRWVGSLIRRKLHLVTCKSHGNYVIPPEELPKLDRLYARYGIASEEPETPPEPDPFASG